MLIKEGKTNIKYLLIVVVLATIVGGITYWQYQEMQKEELGGVEVNIPEKVVGGETTNWEIYRDEEYRFELEYPGNWQISEATVKHKEDYIVIFTNPDSDKQDGQPFFPKITVSFEPLGYVISLERYTTDVEGFWTEYLNDYKSTGKEKINIGGESAYIIGGTFEEDNLNLQIKALIINKESHHFLVALKSLESTWSKHNELFVQILSTFKFLE